MPATVASMSGVIKDAWTSQTILQQFYNENPVLEKIKRITGTMIGLQAQVPIHKTRSGGYTSANAAGGSLNPAGQQGVDQALYTLIYHWFQVALETGALNQTGGSSQAIVSAKDLEIQGSIDDMSRQCSRQLVGNGDGLIAKCAVTTASTTLALDPAGLGFDAIVRGHLYIGQVIDIGSAADSDSVATGVTIVDVGESATTPTLTLSSAVTAAVTDFVSIANPNSTTAPNPELNGFRNIAGSNGSLGGINPATAGNGYWRPALVDSTTTTFSLAMALNLQRSVFQKSGKYSGTVFTSAKQQQKFYELLQNQVRWSGDNGMGAGGVGGLVGLTWNGMGINVLPDIYDKEWYYITLDDLVRITGTWTEPKWVSDIEGSGGSLRWNQGTTSFSEGVVFPFQVGAQRRRTHAAATNLTAA